MKKTDPSFTLGIEEEYLVVDQQTLDLAEAPEALMDDLVARLGGRVSPEFLRCQIEVGTSVCATIEEARTELAELRRTVRDACAEYGLAPIAASTHPSAISS